MPHTLSIDRRRGRAVVRWRALVPSDEARTVLETLIGHSEGLARLDVLHDLRRARVTAKANEVRGLADAYKGNEARFVGGRAAFVAMDDVTFGITPMYVTLAEGGPREMEVFRDIETARDWLGW